MEKWVVSWGRTREREGARGAKKEGAAGEQGQERSVHPAPGRGSCVPCLTDWRINIVRQKLIILFLSLSFPACKVRGELEWILRGQMRRKRGRG